MRTPQPTAVPAPEVTPTPVVVEGLDPTGCEVCLWHSLIGAKERGLQELAERFADGSDNGIRVRVEYHSPLHSEVMAAVAAGTPPDLLVASCDEIAELARSNLVQPLGLYLNSGQSGLSALEEADLWPATLRDGCSSEAGENLGLLFDRQLVLMYYNVSLLDQLGEASVPETWEHFRQLCNAARNAESGTWGFVATAEGGTVANWILGLGGAILDGSTDKALLDSPEAIAALSVLADMLQDGCGHCSSGPFSGLEEFARGEVLFAFGSSAELSSTMVLLTTDQPGLEWSVAPVPHLTQDPVVWADGSVMAILRTTPSQQLASWLFLRSLLRPSNDARWALATGAMPVLRSTKYRTDMELYMQAHPQYRVASELLAYARSGPATRRWADVRALLARAAEAICQGQADPAEVLASIDSAADALLSR